MLDGSATPVMLGALDVPGPVMDVGAPFVGPVLAAEKPVSTFVPDGAGGGGVLGAGPHGGAVERLGGWREYAHALHAPGRAESVEGTAAAGSAPPPESFGWGRVAAVLGAVAALVYILKEVRA